MSSAVTFAHVSEWAHSMQSHHLFNISSKITDWIQAHKILHIIMMCIWTHKEFYVPFSFGCRFFFFLFFFEGNHVCLRNVYERLIEYRDHNSYRRRAFVKWICVLIIALVAWNGFLFIVDEIILMRLTVAPSTTNAKSSRQHVTRCCVWECQTRLNPNRLNGQIKLIINWTFRQYQTTFEEKLFFIEWRRCGDHLLFTPCVFSTLFRYKWKKKSKSI